MDFGKSMPLFVFGLVLAVLLPGAAEAAPPVAEDGQQYVVQADDWLGTLADKFYGDPLAYPVIVEATNVRATTDHRYAPIEDPGRLSVGQVLFVPALDKIPEALIAQTPLERSLAPAGVITSQDSPTAEQLRLLAELDVKGTPPELYNEVWLNSEPLKLADLRGKVVLVEFWTFG